MLAYTIPPLITGWIVGSLVKKFSKKMIVLGSLLSGSFLLIFVSYINIKFSLIVIFFLVSFFFALIWPTINGAYIDKIEKESSFREEIETIDDWFTNIGDTLGPIMGGYAAELLTVKNSFQAMGILGILITLILIKFTPRDLI
jgi:MFS family permease